MASKRYMPEGLHLKGIGVGALSIVAAIAFALTVAYAITHVGVEGPRPWPGTAAGHPPSIRADAILQPDPARDVQAFVAQKRRLLDGYAWVDRERTVARIPIERAMALLAQRASGPTR